MYSVAYERRKLRRIYRDGVLADRQEQQSIEPVGTRGGFLGEPGLHVSDGDASGRDRARGLVGDGTLD